MLCKKKNSNKVYFHGFLINAIDGDGTAFGSWDDDYAGKKGQTQAMCAGTPAYTHKDDSAQNKLNLDWSGDLMNVSKVQVILFHKTTGVFKHYVINFEEFFDS